jgi:hypothetical protein
MSSDPGEVESIETFRRKRHEMRLALIEVLNDPRAVDFDAVGEVERTAAGMRSGPCCWSGEGAT